MKTGKTNHTIKKGRSCIYCRFAGRLRAADNFCPGNPWDAERCQYAECNADSSRHVLVVSALLLARAGDPRRRVGAPQRRKDKLSKGRKRDDLLTRNKIDGEAVSNKLMKKDWKVIFSFEEK
jgi:hypothetical protein